MDASRIEVLILQSNLKAAWSTVHRTSSYSAHTPSALAFAYIKMNAAPDIRNIQQDYKYKLTTGGVKLLTEKSRFY